MFKKLTNKKLDRKDLIKFGSITGLMEIVYVVLVAGFFIVSESLFPATANSLIMGIVAVLTLMVISAGISAVLVLGLPLYFVMQKKYYEAVTVLLSSIVIMVVVFFLIILGEIFIY